MTVTFIASNIILSLTLLLTVWLSMALPPLLVEFVYFEWLSVIATGFVINVLIGRSYDFLVPTISNILPRPITTWVFTVASVVVVGLVFLAALRIQVAFLQNPQQFPEALIVSFGFIFLGSFEAWRYLLSPYEIPFLPKLIFAMLLGFLLFAIAFLAPIFIIGKFVNYYNAGFASYVAGWVAGLSSRLLKQFLISAELEINAGGKLIKGVVERDAPVAIAVVFAYIFFKVSGVNPIVFSILVGIIATLIAQALAYALPTE